MQYKLNPLDSLELKTNVTAPSLIVPSLTVVIQGLWLVAHGGGS